jgi:hypothetical protein
MSVTLRTENIQTTIHALDLDFAGRMGTAGYDEAKPIHIHRRNRPYVWNQQMQVDCYDSIKKGFYIPPIICCSRIVNGMERREVMEGGNRITTFRRILQKQVLELSDSELNTVRSHPITLVVMRGLTPFQQRQMFRRLNKNVKVSDGQLYWMSSDDSPLIKEALAFLNDSAYPLRARITSTFFDTTVKPENDNGKMLLANAVALVSGALNGVEYITKSFGRQEEKVESQVPVDRDRVVTIIGLVLDVFRSVEEQSPLNNKAKMKAQWSVGKYLGAILYDILMNPGDIRRVQVTWTKYLVAVRKGESNAEEAIEIKGAQNINPDKLKKKCHKVEVYLKEKRLVTDDELNDIKHQGTIVADESDDEDDSESV